MAKSDIERARAYRERKRHGVTQHACDQCGHTHYPSQRDAAKPESSHRDEPPPSQCDACATWQANLQTAIDRGKAYQQEAIGLRHDLTLMERSYQAARATLIAHGLPDPEE